MNPLHTITRRAFTLIEVLLALFVFTFGLLGLLGVMSGLLQSVSVIDEKHQTADLAALVQEAIRFDPSASPKKALPFDEIYSSLMSKPKVFLTYTVQGETRQTKIVPVSTGITQADLENLDGPIAKIIAQRSLSYRSVTAPDNSGKVTKLTEWKTNPSDNPDPFVTIDAYVYILPRPTLPGDLDLTERHPEIIRPARRFTLTLTR